MIPLIVFFLKKMTQNCTFSGYLSTCYLYSFMVVISHHCVPAMISEFKHMNSMSFTWRGEVLQLSRNEGQRGGWCDRRWRGDVWRRHWDMDGIELSHSLVGGTPTLIPATQGVSNLDTVPDVGNRTIDLKLISQWSIKSFFDTRWSWPSHKQTSTLSQRWWPLEVFKLNPEPVCLLKGFILLILGNI